jgi:pimeloyl-ACP methyl ester carboxylesterase
VQQHIDRATARDGSEIAYATLGEGRPVVYVGGWLSHLELSWTLRAEREFYEGMTSGCRLVRYDRAGCGLSAPLRRPPSLDGEVEQLDAVIRAAAGAGPIDLVGASLGALVAAAWAAAHPGAVRRLVLYGGWARGADISTAGAREHVLGLVASHWGLGSDVLTDIFAPDADAATRAQFARYQRACSTAATARALLALSYEADISGLLTGIDAPTLVVHRADDRAAPVAQARAFAAGIPGAELVVLPGRSHLPYLGDTRALLAAIRRFLGLRVGPRAAGTLTGRQLEVAALIGAGCTNREIAARLGIAERSAEGHVERIRLRLGVRSRAQVASWYAARK